ncbi:unnamed protein product [Polarella glacialis]|uniref:Maspardin n=1 Tax=Polarella glacialis TaxID=89957 RepID=A0A813KP40_POLGL|nr:unnamed protein product [Polarella glacialis]
MAPSCRPFAGAAPVACWLLQGLLLTARSSQAGQQLRCFQLVGRGQGLVSPSSAASALGRCRMQAEESRSGESSSAAFLSASALAAGSFALLQVRQSMRSRGGGGSVVRKEAAVKGLPLTSSVVVFGWFGATQRELEMVQRVYRKNGYDIVTVVQSSIAQMTSPRGWCGTVKAHVKMGDDHPLARHVDVVHCLSGGFLNYYLLKASHVPLSCRLLLLDSTPILPKPQAFTTFTRQFLTDAGRGRAVSMFPRQLHEGLVHVRWVLSARRALAEERLASLWRAAMGAVGFKVAPASPARHWVRLIMGLAVRGSYDRVVRHTLSKVFGGSPDVRPPETVVFLHNPEDPYLDNSDVENTVAAASQFGPSVSEQLVTTGHIQTLFRKPKNVFSQLR